MRRLVLALLMVSGFGSGPAPVVGAERAILVVGDSLSAAHGIDVRSGWVALLQRRLEQQHLGYKIVNASISGDTSANGLARLPSLLSQHRPTIVIVALGGNDGLRGLSPEQMKHNIAAMVTKAKMQGAKVLLVGVPLPPNYGKRYTDKFDEVYGQIAADQGIPLVPSILDGVADQRALFQQDGIHPTAQAQPRLLENVWAALRPML